LKNPFAFAIHFFRSLKALTAAVTGFQARYFSDDGVE